MTPHVNLTQLTLLIGAGVLGAVLLVSVLYKLHKSIQRSLKPEGSTSPRMRVENESAFSLAAMQAVITQLKREQKSTQEKLLAAERRADETARRLEVVGCEMVQGLIIFNHDGYVVSANPRAREMLGPDTWSRRHYPEILASLPKVAGWVGASLESGIETRNAAADFDSADKGVRAIIVSVLPIHDKLESVEAVVCLLIAVGSNYGDVFGRSVM